MKATVLALAALAIGVASVPAVSADLDKAVKARKAQMALYAWNLGQLGAMAKGAVPYNAEVAKATAEDLAALASVKGPTMWPAGSDATAMPGVSRAKLEAWSTYPAIIEKNDMMANASAALAAVAGDGLDAMRGAIGPVGGACKSCHETYRAPKN